MQEESKQQTISVAAIAQPQNDTITLLEAIGILWKRRLFLCGMVLLGAVVGLLVSFWIRPQFTSDALLQIDVKGNKASKAMGEMGALLEVASPADAEIELIKSRMVLSYVVEEEHLCFSATPVNKLKRLLHKEGRMDIEALEIPEVARADEWLAVATGANTYKVITPEGSTLVEGNVGDLLKAPYAGDTLSIRVKLLRAEDGEVFRIGQSNPLMASRDLSKSLKVAEKGKQTGIIGVSYSHRYADRAASILNTIANTYLRQNVEMRSAEAEKTLEFLEQQLPGVKSKLDSAEKVLADYRHSIGSVDMTGETQVHLQKEVDLQKQILALEQERQQATRLFKEEHPTVRTIIKQQEKLRGELAKLKANAEKMPLTQQEVMRLQEEVQVNNALYTTMLNNIQQLRVVRAGEVGNVRIVDYAQIEPLQSKPKKLNILICAVAASFMIGVLIVFLLRMLQNGVRSSSEIERETDVCVYAKIPECHNAILHRRKHKGHTAGQPLVSAAPDDPASEAIRSLQTAMDFSTTGANKNIMVTGLIPGVGKSFVSLNLAALHAVSGKKVLLIDADMRRGVHRGRKNAGLADVLAGKKDIMEASVESPVKNLFVMGAGRAAVSPSELLRGKVFADMLAKADENFDLVIVDTPPVSLVTDAELIWPVVDFNLVVLHYGKHSMDEIKETIKKLKLFGDKPCAFVMNHCEHDRGHYYGYGYYGKY
ncbi:MAG: polysaccharide biosynthesis tyrosine autokinase [Fibrobacter sp.]|nr:polysaccharide biosynthesis tyrosine autokinase [Fibrobacter sp.]